MRIVHGIVEIVAKIVVGTIWIVFSYNPKKRRIVLQNLVAKLDKMIAYLKEHRRNAHRL